MKTLRRLAKKLKRKERRQRTSEMLSEKKKSDSELIKEAGTQMQSLAHLVAIGTTNGPLTKTAPNGIPKTTRDRPHKTVNRQDHPRWNMQQCNFGRHHQGNGVEMQKFAAYSLTIFEFFDHAPPG